jgi:two-component system sensor histidine kinase CpxA
MTDSPIKEKTFKIHMTLFWRLFLSLLFTILVTSALSIVVERVLNGQELATRMDAQIDKLLVKREQLVEALKIGDLSEVTQLYDQDRQLMNQIRIYDEQGSIIFPRYRYKKGRKEGRPAQVPAISKEPTLSDNSRVYNDDRENREFGNAPRPDRDPNNRYSNNRDFDSNRNPNDNETPNKKPFTLNSLLQPLPPHKSTANIESRPELADVSVVLPDEQTVIIQLRPHLLFDDVLELQRGNFAVRLILIILFSVLVCFWLSRTMTQRIRRVQYAVHRMLVGDYQANPSLSKLGTDELGLLAKDVAQLSTRLADSELARKQMLSDISHELRSPLARLDVATELTRDFAPHASRYLDRIDKESVRMNELIEQIIRIQSLQMQQYTIEDLESELVHIPDIITEIGQDVCFEFQNKHVHWQWQSPMSSWTVLGNQEQLHSALENVIRNAFMHTPPNSTVMVEVSKIKTDDHTKAIQICITDEGGGVAEGDLERIFQPFVRLDSDRNRQTGGYGLGLAIVHAVIMAHKGQLSAHNRKDGIRGLVVQIVLAVE